MIVEELRRVLIGCPDDALVVIGHAGGPGGYLFVPLGSVDSRPAVFRLGDVWDPADTDPPPPPGAVPCIRLWPMGS